MSTAVGISHFTVWRSGHGVKRSRQASAAMAGTSNEGKIMSLIEPGGIDCDIHPAVPNLKALHPYLTDHWRDIIVQRGMHELNSIAYPANSPLTARPDWRVAGIRPGSDLELLRQHALNPFQTSIAIANCLYGVQLLFSEDMGAGFARAVNDWMAAEWLDKEPRLRASIVVPAQNPEMAVDEINRVAPDKRFVQVLLLVMNDMPLGKRHYWPIYAAARKHGLTIGIHAGSAYRHSCRQRLSASGNARGMAVLLYRGLRRPGRRLPAGAVVADLRRRVHQVPRPESGTPGVRLHLAARASLATDKVLARPADGSAMAGPTAGGNRQIQCAVNDPTLRRAAHRRHVPEIYGTYGLG